MLVDVLSKRKYRAKVDNVFPHVKRLSYRGAERCFLGISLGNNTFRDDKLDAMLRWVSNWCGRCHLLIGDSIHRINISQEQGISEEDALCEALRMGEDFIKEVGTLLSSYQTRMELDVITCAQLQKRHDYIETYESLRRLCNEDMNFRASVQHFSEHYHSRKGTVYSDARLAASERYFLEEFAIFSCLVRDGCDVMVYPGTFSTLAEIAEGHFPDAPKALQSLTTVSLCIKGI